jgi:hypothetical protein
MGDVVDKDVRLLGLRNLESAVIKWGKSERNF